MFLVIFAIPLILALPSRVWWPVALYAPLFVVLAIDTAIKAYKGRFARKEKPVAEAAPCTRCGAAGFVRSLGPRTSAWCDRCYRIDSLKWTLLNPANLIALALATIVLLMAGSFYVASIRVIVKGWAP